MGAGMGSCSARHKYVHRTRQLPPLPGPTPRLPSATQSTQTQSRRKHPPAAASTHHFRGGQERARLSQALQRHGAVAQALAAHAVNQDVHLVAALWWGCQVRFVRVSKAGRTGYPHLPVLLPLAGPTSAGRRQVQQPP